MDRTFWEKIQVRGVSGIARSVLGRVGFPALNDPLNFLTKVSSVIHVGANSGQERDIYASHGLNVLWIEPLPKVFAELCENIKQCPGQTAIQALVADRDDHEFVFHVANNDGKSSSILDLHDHKDIWPDVAYENHITLKSTTLDTLIRRLGKRSDEYQALIMDTQGSELLVLKGATELLQSLRFIKTEAADFESYVGCARVDDLVEYLSAYGFRLFRKDKFAQGENSGGYYELIFKKGWK